MIWLLWIIGWLALGAALIAWGHAVPERLKGRLWSLSVELAISIAWPFLRAWDILRAIPYNWRCRGERRGPWSL